MSFPVCNSSTLLIICLMTMYPRSHSGGDDYPFTEDAASIEEVELPGEEREGEKGGRGVEDFGVSE